MSDSAGFFLFGEEDEYMGGWNEYKIVDRAGQASDDGVYQEK